MKMASQNAIIGKTNYRGKEQVFCIKPDDRRRHMYLCGKTGMGKSNFILQMAAQDIQAGRGVCFIDPHGDAAESLLDFIPSQRISDVIYFNPSDANYPVGFNIMGVPDPSDYEKKNLVASGVVDTFKKLWGYSWGPQLENNLRLSVLSLTAYPNTTLLHVLRFLIDKRYRDKIIDKEQDPVVKMEWQEHYQQFSDRDRVSMTESVINKLSHFLANPLLRNIICQPKTSFDVKGAMDNGKIIILNLAKGRIGEDISTLLGSFLITQIQLASMERQSTPEDCRRDFYLYVDEFQNFITESFISILSEARKFRLNLIIANQYLNQLILDGQTDIRDAIFGNVGTIVSFRVGADDAERLEKEFSPVVSAQDLVNLPKYQMYIKLMIDGLAGDAFSATTLPPLGVEHTTNNQKKIIRLSRERYSKPRAVVETGIEQITGSQPEKNKDKLAKKNKLLNPGKYKVQCSGCGGKAEVKFNPDGKRPVFCPECLRKHQSERDKRKYRDISVS